MFGTFIQSIVTFTDAIFISELGDTAIGAFGNGSLLYVSFFMFIRGLSDGTQIEVAFLDGKKEYSTIGKTLLNAQFFQLILSVIIFSCLFFLGEFIIFKLSSSQDVGEAMLAFIKVRGWGIFFAAQHITLVGFFIGLGRTNVILYSALLIAITNICLDYCFVRGNFGFPEMGLQGAPLASSIAEAVGFIFLFTVLLKNKALQKIGYTFRIVNIALKKHFKILSLSFPLMLQGLVSLATWLVFFTLIEHMGKSALETAHNIRYMYFLAFVPIFGFAASTKTIVSNLKGQNELKKIQTAQGKLMILSVGFMVLFFHGGILYPETLIRLVDHNPNISAQVLADSVYIVQFVSGSIFIFAIVAVLFNTVSGLGETKVSFSIEVISIIIYLIACHFFISKWQWDIKDVWWVEYIYFISLGIFSFIYLLYYRKKYIYV